MLIPMPESQPAIFLDRDGTLMREVNYCRRPEDVELYEGAREAIQAFREMGYKIVVVSNQSGIGRGMISLEEYEAVNAEFLRQIGPGLVDAVYFCPDVPESASQRRKPAPGMLQEAARDLKLDLSLSWTIGDKASDIAAGVNAGTRTVLVQTGYGLQQIGVPADIIAEDLAAALQGVRAFRPSGEVSAA